MNKLPEKILLIGISLFKDFYRGNRSAVIDLFCEESFRMTGESVSLFICPTMFPG